MIAYKFLRAGAVAPFTRFDWPVGEWVEALDVDPCRSGIHACRVRDLPLWLGAELWEVELGGEIVELDRKLAATRGRLLRRLEAWNDDLRAEFGRFCLRRARRGVGYLPVVSGYVIDIDGMIGLGRVPIGAFAAARAAELSDGPAGYARERAAQAAWLADRLGLERSDRSDV
jgi:hypothetical protein